MSTNRLRTACQDSATIRSLTVSLISALTHSAFEGFRHWQGQCGESWHINTVTKLGSRTPDTDCLYLIVSVDGGGQATSLSPRPRAGPWGCWPWRISCIWFIIRFAIYDDYCLMILDLFRQHPWCLPSQLDGLRPKIGGNRSVFYPLDQKDLILD